MVAIESSNLGRLCEPGDSNMADKGFNIQDLMAVQDIHVNIPTFLQGIPWDPPKISSRVKNHGSPIYVSALPSKNRIYMK